MPPAWLSYGLPHRYPDNGGIDQGEAHIKTSARYRDMPARGHTLASKTVFELIGTRPELQSERSGRLRIECPEIERVIALYPVTPLRRDIFQKGCPK